MIRNELHFWSGLLASAIGAVIAIGVVPHPVDKYALGVVAFCAAISAYHITPPAKPDRR